MIALKTWREVRGMALAYIIILEVLMIPAILLWPDLQEGSTFIAKIMPAKFLKDMMSQAMQNYPAYMAVQVYFKGVNIIGIAAAVLLGTGMIARERENMTLEFLLSRPISRSRILWNKFWVLALCVTIPIFLTSWSAIPLSELESVDEQLSFQAVTIASLHASAFVLLVLAMTMLASILARAQVHAAFWVGAILIVQIAVFFIQEIRVYSAFRLSDFRMYGPIMAENVTFADQFFGSTLWLLLGVVGVYAVADRLFARTPL